MQTVLKELIARLPVRTLTFTVVFVLTWIAGLTVAGLATHRAVDFFPPKIGSDPIIQKEIATLSSEVKQLYEKELTYRSQIFSAQQKAMDDLISIRRSISYGEYEAKSNIKMYSEALKNEDEKLIKIIEELKNKVTAVEKQL